MGKDIGSGLFGMMPFGSEVWSFLSSKIFGDTYYGFESVTDSAISDLIDAVGTTWNLFDGIITGDEPFSITAQKKKIRSVISAASKILGIPIDNIYNTVTALYKNGRYLIHNKYLADYYSLAWDDNPAKNGKQFVKIAFQAYKAGEKDTYDQLIQIFTEDVGMDEDTMWGNMRSIYASQYAPDSKQSKLEYAYEHLYELYQTDQDAFDAEYDTMRELGFSEDQIKKGIENEMKQEAGVNSVNDLEERFTTPEEEERTEEFLDEEIRGTSLYKNANDADRKALEQLAMDYDKKDTSQWNRGREAVENGVFSKEEYLKFWLELQKADQPTEKGVMGTYTVDEQKAAIEAMGWSDKQAAEYWDYLPNTSKNPYIEDDTKKTTSAKKTISSTSKTTSSQKKTTSTTTKPAMTSAQSKTTTKTEPETTAPKSGSISGSSLLRGYSYDNGNLSLEVNGRWYTYYGVPEDVFNGLMASDSKGNYYNNYIKGIY